MHRSWSYRPGPLRIKTVELAAVALLIMTLDVEPAPAGSEAIWRLTIVEVEKPSGAAGHAAPSVRLYAQRSDPRRGWPRLRGFRPRQGCRGGGALWYSSSGLGWFSS